MELAGDGGTQWSASLGSLRFKWERHGEFSSYTVFAVGLGSLPFAAPAVALLPAGWLAGVPGQTVFAAHAELAAATGLASGPGDAPSAAQLAAYFDNQMVVGVAIGGVIPVQDYDYLYEHGAVAIFAPGTNIPEAGIKLLTLLLDRAREETAEG